MKTNFLYFKEKGYQQFTATAAQTNFTINGDNEWDTDVTADTQVKVSVTFLEAQTTKVGDAYSGGAVDAGETVVVNNTGKSIGGSGTNDIILANQGADGTNGITISAGDIVTIERIPIPLKHEACLRADRFLAVYPTAVTTTRVSFKAAEGTGTYDHVTFTHSDDDGLALRKISNYFAEVMSGQAANRDGFMVVADRYNNIVAPELLDIGITKMTVLVQD